MRNARSRRSRHRRRRLAVALIGATAALGHTAAGAPASKLAGVSGEVAVTVDAGGDTITYSVAARPPKGYRIAAENDFAPVSGCNAIDDAWKCPADSDDVPAVTRVTGSAAADSVSGSCRGGTQSALIFPAGAGDDAADLAGCHAALVELGEGNDRARVAAGVVNGDGGNDAITGGPQADTLRGGPGRDALDGDGGDDRLEGGPGSDHIAPGLGDDIVSGGDDGDTVSYADRHTQVRVSLDGQANDGQDGERDHLLTDIEDVIAGEGDDELTGDAGANRIDGNAGSDVITPGGGNDVVNADTGNDRVYARDGAIDQIYCGDGNDQAIVDTFDVVTSCEDVQASREQMADVDADGIPVPADCNDHDRGIRPGLRDRPGNGIDEDCSGRDAPFARVHTAIEWQATWNRRGTAITRLKLKGIPRGATAELRCRSARPARCFRKVKRRFPRGAESADLRRPLKRIRLRRGDRLEVRVTASDSIGKVAQFTVRTNAAPRVTSRCLAPGRLAPHRCR